MNQEYLSWQGHYSCYLCKMKPEMKKIYFSFIPGFLFILILAGVKIYEISRQTQLAGWGLYPRSLDSIHHIFTFPLIHDDLKHFYSNAIPLLILMAMMSYFYREVAVKVFVFTWILHGIWLWIGGRPAFHIGASGIVYGLSSFLFFSGIWRRERRTMAVSLIIVFLYGGMVWGLFPFFIGTSWEAHLFGALAGLVLSWFYRKTGIQRTVYEWENDSDDDDTPQYWMLNTENPAGTDPAEQSKEASPFPEPPAVRYDYIESKKEKNKEDENETGNK